MLFGCASYKGQSAINFVSWWIVMTNLTTEQCDEFRRHPGTFNDMVRHIYNTAEKQAYERCHKALIDTPSNHNIISARLIIGKMIDSV